MNKNQYHVTYYVMLITLLLAIVLNPCQVCADVKHNTKPAKYEPVDNKIYHGVCINPESAKFTENLDNYIKIIGHRPIVITYFAHVWNKGKYLDWTYYGELLNKVDSVGAIPFVKATTADWDKKSGLWWSADDILLGKHDNYFIKAADTAKEFRKPMFLSWNHEMNGDWYPWAEAFAIKHPGKSDWTAEKYVKVWQHIVNIYRKQGAHNVAFAWSPDVDGREIGSYKASESWRAYWPGSDFVDWIAPSLYNNVDPIQLDSLVNSHKEKPIFISEWGTNSDRRKWYRPVYPGDAAWIKRFFEAVLNRYANVKGISYFQWEPAYYVQRDNAQVEVYRDNIGNSRIFHGPRSKSK